MHFEHSPAIWAAFPTLVPGVLRVDDVRSDAVSTAPTSRPSACEGGWMSVRSRAVAIAGTATISSPNAAFSRSANTCAFGCPTSCGANHCRPTFLRSTRSPSTTVSVSGGHPCARR